MGFRALVVDDDEMNVLLVQRVLEGRGVAVEVARDGMSALAALKRSRPDLVILDIMMPGISGAEVLDRIKANPALATIPVIMLTAKADDGDLIESYRSGADYYVTKPLVPSQLLYGVGLILGSDFRSDPDPKTDQTPSRPRLVRPRQ